MHSALNSFERYPHGERKFPLLIELALIHYQFESIHPFVDGNGRIGRLLTSLLLVHWELIPQPLLYMSAFFERNRQKYYDLLLSVGAAGNWIEWISFFLEGVEKQSMAALAKAKKLIDLQTEWKNRVTGARSSTLLHQLIDILFESPVLMANKEARLLGITYMSARNNINKLVEANILTHIQLSPRRNFFVANEIFEISEKYKK